MASITILDPERQRKTGGNIVARGRWFARGFGTLGNASYVTGAR